jgi:hypoxanthine phosphoribosyltransferase
VTLRNGSTYSVPRIAKRVAEMARAINKDLQGRRLDVVVAMDRSFMFAADLVRHLKGPVACYFAPAETRDIERGGKMQHELFFRSWPGHKDRDVLLVDAVLDTGVTQEFLLRRIGESQPRSVRLAVLLDKTAGRRVAIEPDYFGFRTASNGMWVGYGLSGPSGLEGNLGDLRSAGGSAAKNSKVRRRKKQK